MSLSLSLSTTSAVAIAAAGLALVALVLAVVALVKLRRMRRAYTLLQGPDADSTETFVDVVARKTEEVQRLQDVVASTNASVEALRVDLGEALRHVAVVRYDAFNDMGGRMSFTAAMLDDHGDGLVITSINGRTETRTYAKGVKAGSSDATLSPEEEQAITFARRGAAAARG